MLAPDGASLGARMVIGLKGEHWCWWTPISGGILVVVGIMVIDLKGTMLVLVDTYKANVSLALH